MKRALFLALMWFNLGAISAYSQTEICDNGIDDDGDGFIDCYDPDCSNNNACYRFNKWMRIWMHLFVLIKGCLASSTGVQKIKSSS